MNTTKYYKKIICGIAIFTLLYSNWLYACPVSLLSKDTELPGLNRLLAPLKQIVKILESGITFSAELRDIRIHLSGLLDNEEPEKITVVYNKKGRELFAFGRDKILHIYLNKKTILSGENIKKIKFAGLKIDIYWASNSIAKKVISIRNSVILKGEIEPVVISETIEKQSVSKSGAAHMVFRLLFIIAASFVILGIILVFETIAGHFSIPAFIKALPGLAALAGGIGIGGWILKQIRYGINLSKKEPSYDLLSRISAPQKEKPKKPLKFAEYQYKEITGQPIEAIALGIGLTEEERKKLALLSKIDDDTNRYMLYCGIRKKTGSYVNRFAGIVMVSEMGYGVISVKVEWTKHEGNRQLPQSFIITKLANRDPKGILFMSQDIDPEVMDRVLPNHTIADRKEATKRFKERIYKKLKIRGEGQYTFFAFDKQDFKERRRYYFGSFKFSSLWKMAEIERWLYHLANGLFFALVFSSIYSHAEAIKVLSQYSYFEEYIGLILTVGVAPLAARSIAKTIHLKWDPVRARHSKKEGEDIWLSITQNMRMGWRIIATFKQLARIRIFLSIISILLIPAVSVSFFGISSPYIYLGLMFLKLIVERILDEYEKRYYAEVTETAILFNEAAKREGYAENYHNIDSFSNVFNEMLYACGLLIGFGIYSNTIMSPIAVPLAIAAVITISASSFLLPSRGRDYKDYLKIWGKGFASLEEGKVLLADGITMLTNPNNPLVGQPKPVPVTGRFYILPWVQQLGITIRCAPGHRPVITMKNPAGKLGRLKAKKGRCRIEWPGQNLTIELVNREKPIDDKVIVIEDKPDGSCLIHFYPKKQLLPTLPNAAKSAPKLDETAPAQAIDTSALSPVSKISGTDLSLSIEFLKKYFVKKIEEWAKTRHLDIPLLFNLLKTNEDNIRRDLNISHTNIVYSTGRIEFIAPGFSLILDKDSQDKIPGTDIGIQIETHADTEAGEVLTLKDDKRAVITDRVIPGIKTIPVPKNRRILVIEISPEDHLPFSGNLAGRLSKQNTVEVYTAENLPDLREKIKKFMPDIILLPDNSPEIDRLVRNSKFEHILIYYESLKTLPPVNAYLNISEEDMAIGEKSIREYKTQIQRTRYDEIAEFFSQYTGAILGHPYAQTFIQTTIEDGRLKTPDFSQMTQVETPADCPLVTISPHPDDMPISLFGLARDKLRKTHQGAIGIVDLIFTYSERGVPGEGTIEERREIRIEEDESAKRVLEEGVPGRIETVYFGFDLKDDSALQEQAQRVKSYFESLCERYKGNLSQGLTVALPHPEDNQPAHRRSTEITLNVLKEISKEKNIRFNILFYKSVWSGSFNTFYVSDKDLGNNETTKPAKRTITRTIGELSGADFSVVSPPPEKLGGEFAERQRRYTHTPQDYIKQPPDKRLLDAALSKERIVQSHSGIRINFTHEKSEINDGQKIIACLYAYNYLNFIHKNIARASGTPPRKLKFITGYDTRPTSSALLEAQIRGFTAAAESLGIELEIINLGTLPKPIYQNAVRSFQANGGVYLTASHNEFTWNGLEYSTKYKSEHGFTFGGALLNVEESRELIESFRDSIDSLNSGASEIITRINNIWPAAAVDLEKRSEAIKFYKKFISEKFGGFEIRPGDKVVLNPNGSAACGIYKEILEELGFTVIEINAVKGNPCHMIDPVKDPSSFNKVAAAINENNALFGMTFDCDGDRAYLTILNQDGSQRQISPQDTAAINVGLVLQWCRKNHLLRDKTAIVVNDPTSRRIRDIAYRFGAEVFSVEVGEPNLVNKMHELRKAGYYVPVAVEGSNGGTIFFDSMCRDGILSTISVALWETSPDCRFELPRYYNEIRTLFDLDIPIKEVKLELEKFIKKNSGDLKLLSDTNRSLPVIDYEIHYFEGTEHIINRNRIPGQGMTDETGGWKLILKTADGTEHFLWLRTSKTEPNIVRIGFDSPYKNTIPLLKRIFHQTFIENRHFINEDYEKTSREAAEYFIREIRRLIEEKGIAVVCFATGDTPKGMYKIIREEYRDSVDWSKVITFNLDEYVFPKKTGDLKKHPYSYRYFMEEELFGHLPIPEQNIHFLNGTSPNIDEFKLAIEKAGGIDLSVLGIGRNGHIGFNEPGSSFESPVRKVKLAFKTRWQNRGKFGGKGHFWDILKVPRYALTMGIREIMDSRKIMLLATGERKKAIMKQTLYGHATKSCPASILQTHMNIRYFTDEIAAGKRQTKRPMIRITRRTIQREKFEEMLSSSKMLERYIQEGKIGELIPEWNEFAQLQENPEFAIHHPVSPREHILLAFKRLESDYFQNIIEQFKLKGIGMDRLRRALFFHDFGKITVLKKSPSYSKDEETNHPEYSAQMAEKILIRLGYSREEIADDLMLIRYHDVLEDMAQHGESKIEPLDFVKNLGHTWNLKLLQVLQLIDAASVRQEFENSLSTGLERRINDISDIIAPIFLTTGRQRSNLQTKFVDYLSDIKRQNKDIMSAFANLRESVQKNNIEIEPGILYKAFLAMNRSHLGQLRKDEKTPYVIHCIDTARILADELKIKNPDIIIAALLHDVLEDTRTTVEAIEGLFGKKVADMVTLLSKPNVRGYPSKHERDKDYYHRMIYGTKDIIDSSILAGVQTIKIADRINNLRTLIGSSFAQSQIDDTYESFIRHFIIGTEVPPFVKIRLIEELIKQGRKWEALSTKQIRTLNFLAQKISEVTLKEPKIEETPYDFIRGLIDFLQKGKPETPLMFAFGGMSGVGRSIFTAGYLQEKLLQAGKKVVVFDQNDYLLPRAVRDKCLREAIKEKKPFYEQREKLYDLERFKQEILEPLTRFRKSLRPDLKLSLSRLYNRQSGKLTSRKAYSIDRDTIVLIEGIHILQEDLIGLYDAAFLVHAPKEICLKNVFQREQQKEKYRWRLKFLNWLLLKSQQSERLKPLAWLIRKIPLVEKFEQQSRDKIYHRFNLIDWPSYSRHWLEYLLSSAYIIDNTDYRNPIVEKNRYLWSSNKTIALKKEFTNPGQRMNRKLGSIFKQLKRKRIALYEIFPKTTTFQNIIRHIISVKGISSLLPKGVNLPLPDEREDVLDHFLDRLIAYGKTEDIFFRFLAAYVLEKIETEIGSGVNLLELKKRLPLLTLENESDIKIFKKTASWSKNIFPPPSFHRYGSRKTIHVLIDADFLKNNTDKAALIITKLSLSIEPEQKIQIIITHPSMDINEMKALYKTFYKNINIGSRNTKKERILTTFEPNDISAGRTEFLPRLLQRLERIYKIKPANITIIAPSDSVLMGIQKAKIPDLEPRLNLIFNTSFPEDFLLGILASREWQKVKTTTAYVLYSSGDLRIKVPVGEILALSEEERQFIHRNRILRVLNQLLNRYSRLKLVRKIRYITKKFISRFWPRKFIVRSYIRGYELISKNAPRLATPMRIVSDENMRDKIHLPGQEKKHKTIILQLAQGELLYSHIKELIEKNEWRKAERILKKAFYLLQRLWQYSLADTDHEVNIWKNIIITSTGKLKIVNAGDITDNFNELGYYYTAKIEDARKLISHLESLGVSAVIKFMEEQDGGSCFLNLMKELVKDYDETAAKRILEIYLNLLIREFALDKLESQWGVKPKRRKMQSCKFPGEPDLKHAEKRQIEDFIGRQKTNIIGQDDTDRIISGALKIISERSPPHHAPIKEALLLGTAVPLNASDIELRRYNRRQVFVRLRIVESHEKYFGCGENRFGVPIYPAFHEEKGKLFLNLNIPSALIASPAMTSDILAGIIVHELCELLLGKLHPEAVLEEMYYSDSKIPPRLVWMIDEIGRAAKEGNIHARTILNQLTMPYRMYGVYLLKIQYASQKRIQELSASVTEKARIWIEDVSTPEPQEAKKDEPAELSGGGTTSVDTVGEEKDLETEAKFKKASEIIKRYGELLKSGVSLPLGKGIDTVFLQSEIHSFVSFSFKISKRRRKTLASIARNRFEIVIPNEIGNTAEIGLLWDKKWGLFVWLSDTQKNNFLIYRADECTKCWDENKKWTSVYSTVIASAKNLEEALECARGWMGKWLTEEKNRETAKAIIRQYAETVRKKCYLNPLKQVISGFSGTRFEISAGEDVYIIPHENNAIRFNNVGKQGETYKMKFRLDEKKRLLAVFTLQDNKRKRIVIYSLCQYADGFDGNGQEKKYFGLHPVAEGENYKDVLKMALVTEENILKKLSCILNNLGYSDPADIVKALSNNPDLELLNNLNTELPEFEKILEEANNLKSLKPLCQALKALIKRIKNAASPLRIWKRQFGISNGMLVLKPGTKIKYDIEDGKSVNFPEIGHTVTGPATIEFVLQNTVNLKKLDDKTLKINLAFAPRPAPAGTRSLRAEAGRKGGIKAQKTFYLYIAKNNLYITTPSGERFTLAQLAERKTYKKIKRSIMESAAGGSKSYTGKGPDNETAGGIIRQAFENETAIDVTGGQIVAEAKGILLRDEKFAAKDMEFAEKAPDKKGISGLRVVFIPDLPPDGHYGMGGEAFEHTLPTIYLPKKLYDYLSERHNKGDPYAKAELADYLYHKYIEMCLVYLEKTEIEKAHQIAEHSNYNNEKNIILFETYFKLKEARERLLLYILYEEAVSLYSTGDIHEAFIKAIEFLRYIMLNSHIKADTRDYLKPIAKILKDYRDIYRQEISDSLLTLLEDFPETQSLKLLSEILMTEFQEDLTARRLTYRIFTRTDTLTINGLEKSPLHFMNKKKYKNCRIAVEWIEDKPGIWVPDKIFFRDNDGNIGDIEYPKRLYDDSFRLTGLSIKIPKRSLTHNIIICGTRVASERLQVGTHIFKYGGYNGARARITLGDEGIIRSVHLGPTSEKRPKDLEMMTITCSGIPVFSYVSLGSSGILQRLCRKYGELEITGLYMTKGKRPHTPAISGLTIHAKKEYAGAPVKIKIGSDGRIKEVFIQGKDKLPDISKKISRPQPPPKKGYTLTETMIKVRSPGADENSAIFLPDDIFSEINKLSESQENENKTGVIFYTNKGIRFFRFREKTISGENLKKLISEWCKENGIDTSSLRIRTVVHLHSYTDYLKTTRFSDPLSYIAVPSMQELKEWKIFSLFLSWALKELTGRSQLEYDMKHLLIGTANNRTFFAGYRNRISLKHKDTPDGRRPDISGLLNLGIIKFFPVGILEEDNNAPEYILVPDFMAERKKEKDEKGEDTIAAKIQQSQKLSPEDEAQILKIFEENKGLISKVVKRFFRGYLHIFSFEELAKAGEEGLFKAVIRYNPRLGYDFEQFAIPTIRGVISVYLRTTMRFYRRQTTLSELAFREGEEPIDIDRLDILRDESPSQEQILISEEEEEERSKDIKEMVKDIKGHKARLAFEIYAGIFDGNFHSMEETGRILFKIILETMGPVGIRSEATKEKQAYTRQNISLLIGEARRDILIAEYGEEGAEMIIERKKRLEKKKKEEANRLTGKWLSFTEKGLRKEDWEPISFHARLLDNKAAIEIPEIFTWHFGIQYVNQTICMDIEESIPEKKYVSFKFTCNGEVIRKTLVKFSQSGRIKKTSIIPAYRSMADILTLEQWNESIEKGDIAPYGTINAKVKRYDIYPTPDTGLVEIWLKRKLISVYVPKAYIDSMVTAELTKRGRYWYLLKIYSGKRVISAYVIKRDKAGNISSFKIQKKLLRRQKLSDSEKRKTKHLLLEEVTDGRNFSVEILQAYLDKLNKEAGTLSMKAKKPISNPDYDIGLHWAVLRKIEILQIFMEEYLKRLLRDRDIRGKIIYSLSSLLSSELNDGNKTGRLENFVNLTKGRVEFYPGTAFLPAEGYEYITAGFNTAGTEPIVFMLTEREIKGLGINPSGNRIIIPVEGKRNPVNDIIKGLETLKGADITGDSLRIPPPDPISQSAYSA